jgi:hypothetical protein
MTIQIIPAPLVGIEATVKIAITVGNTAKVHNVLGLGKKAAFTLIILVGPEMLVLGLVIVKQHDNNVVSAHY